MLPTPRCRFDDLSSGAAHAFELSGWRGAIAASDPAGVRPALREAEAAAAAGHWVAGFVTYDAAPGLDPDLAAPGTGQASDLPLAWFGVFRERTPVPPVTAVPCAAVDDAGDGGLALERVDAAWHAESVRAIREGIAAGDHYQVNLTAVLEGPAPADPYRLYQAMAEAQRGAYHAFIDTGHHIVVSASPELFFTRDGAAITMRPMKGTARRGRFDAEDEEAARWLLASAKDRAENVMIVDLVRNDLNRVATDVGVVDLCTLERYPTVWQLTSEVRGRLRTEARLDDVFAALFPSGSVTGAPKIAAMRAIARLERSRRGVYCGAVGYLAPPGERPACAFSVAIRTAVIERSRGLVRYGSGGGITWDSSATGELAELEAKTAIVRRPPPRFELLETMRLDPPGVVELVELHLDRLAASADRLGFTFERGAVRKALDGLGRTDVARRVRLRLARDGSTAIEVDDVPPTVEPVRLAIDPQPFDTEDPLTFHKTTLRQRYDARRVRRPDVDDVVLLNEAGCVTETTIATIAAELDQAWWTPPVADGCLPGVARRAALASGRLRERSLHPADLRRASSLAVLNALRGWRAAVLVE